MSTEGVRGYEQYCGRPRRFCGMPGMSYHREHWKRWASSVGEAVPAVRTAAGPHEAGERLAPPRMPYQRGGHPLVPRRPWQFPGPRPDTRRVTDVLNRLSGLLKTPPTAPGGFGRMDGVARLLHSVPPVELDAVVGRLGPQGLGALDNLIAAVEGDGSRWNFNRVQGFLNFLLENVSPYVVGLLGAHLGCTQPLVEKLWDGADDAGWIQPAGPFVAFGGKGHPAADGFRVEASIAPMAWQDMLQGAVGDCWFLTSTQAVAKANPGFMPRHLWRNPNGSVSAVFYEEETRRPCRITVPPDLPVQRGVLFGATGHTKDPAYAELWPAYYEKAFAQWNGGYDQIEGGWGHEAFTVITGRPVERLDPKSPHLPFEIHQRIRRGCAIAVGTVGGSDRDHLLGGRLVAGHEYFIKDVDMRSGRICLGNPWGDAVSHKVWECWLNHAEAAQHLDEVSVVRP